MRCSSLVLAEATRIVDILYAHWGREHRTVCKLKLEFPGLFASTMEAEERASFWSYNSVGLKTSMPPWPSNEVQCAEANAYL